MSFYPYAGIKKKINVSAIKSEVKAVQKKHFHASCPITRGCPTTMPENIFRKICDLHQAKETPSYCNKICHGENLPPGLTFADNSTIQGATMTTYTTGTCDICGQQKSIKKCIDKMTCSSCDFVYRSIKNNPERVLEKLVETKGKTFVALSLGFDNKEQKTDEIKVLTAHIKELQESIDTAGNTIAENEKEIKYLQESLEAARELSSHGYLTAVTGTVTSRDSAVLDLALDILAGKIQGVDVERLQALR